MSSSSHWSANRAPVIKPPRACSCSMIGSMPSVLESGSWLARFAPPPSPGHRVSLPRRDLPVFGRLAQLVRALPSHGRGHGFESRIAHPKTAGQSTSGLRFVFSGCAPVREKCAAQRVRGVAHGPGARQVRGSPGEVSGVRDAEKGQVRCGVRREKGPQTGWQRISRPLPRARRQDAFTPVPEEGRCRPVRRVNRGGEERRLVD